MGLTVGQIKLEQETGKTISEIREEFLKAPKYLQIQFLQKHGGGLIHLAPCQYPKVKDGEQLRFDQ